LLGAFRTDFCVHDLQRIFPAKWSYHAGMDFLYPAIHFLLSPLAAPRLSAPINLCTPASKPPSISLNRFTNSGWRREK
jgi:hypothetical protein